VVGRLALLVASLAALLGLLEAGLRAVERDLEAARRDAPQGPLHVPCGECGAVYRLNPLHPEVDDLGMRRGASGRPAPGAAARSILVLGDSVTFGYAVEAGRTFTAVLARARPELEVLNAGVTGYGVYNELHDYLERGRALHPDLVIVGLDPNDVVNPRLHWDYLAGHGLRIPAASIPDPCFDRAVALPVVHSALARALHLMLTEIVVSRRQPPVHLTGEDFLQTIDLLLDYDSRQWRWLRSLLGELHRSVADDGAELAVAIFPLDYQLASTYPFHPQSLVLRYCAEEGLRCLDLLPVLRAHREEFPFEDTWHLSERGHELVAQAIEQHLLPKAAGAGAARSGQPTVMGGRGRALRRASRISGPQRREPHPRRRAGRAPRALRLPPRAGRQATPRPPHALDPWLERAHARARSEPA